jgi:MscS family membrane protein
MTISEHGPTHRRPLRGCTTALCCAAAAMLLPALALAAKAAEAAKPAATAAASTAAKAAPAWIQRLPDWLQLSWANISVWQAAGVLLLIFFGLLIRRIVIYLVASRARRLIGRVSRRMESALDKGAKPLSGLAMAFAFSWGFPLLHFSDRVETVIAIAVRILAVSSGVWLIYRLTEVASEWLARKAEGTDTKLDDQLVPLVRRTIKAFVVVIGSIFVLQNLDVDVGSLVAGLGLGGLAFALAAKDTVANFFGAITIFIDRPFQIGDWVVIEKLEGTVEDVGFRTTRIRTFYNSLVTVPNAKLTGTPVDNLGARTYRRIKCDLNLTYGTSPDQIQAFVEGIRAIIVAHPDTRKDYYLVHFNRFGQHSLDILLYCFVQTPSWSDELKAKQELFLSVLKLAGDLSIQFAFPTQTLHVDSFSKKPTARAPERDALTATVEAYGPGGEASDPRGVMLTHGYFAGVSQRGDSAEG